MPETLLSKTVRAHGDYNDALIFRAQIGAVLFGAWPTASAISTLIDTVAAGKVKIPDSYETVGITSEDGVEFSEDISMIEIRGWGSTTVLRRDIESWDHSFQFSMIEDRRIAYDLSAGVDTKGIQMSAGGEWKHTRSARPTTKYRRGLVLAQDYEDDLMVIKGKFYPKVILTERDSETWSNGDDPVMRNCTFGADSDAAVGGPLTEFLIGPGAKAYAAARGIPVAA